jgi:hypothetical protein
MDLFLYNVVFNILVYISINLMNKKDWKSILCYVTNAISDN